MRARAMLERGTRDASHDRAQKQTVGDVDCARLAAHVRF